MKIDVKPYELKLINPFGISRSTRTSHKIIIFSIDDEYFGEASPYAYYGEDFDKTIEYLNETLKDFALEDLAYSDWAMDEVAKKLPTHGAGSSIAALDMAIHDYAAKKAGMPLYKYLGFKHPENKQTSFTIGIDTLDMMLKKVEDAKDFPILKIKLGRDIEQDMTVMKEIRRMTKQVIRVDANGGWTMDNALKCIALLAGLDVEYVEQPLVKGSYEDLAKLKDKSALPIFLDEDILTSMDILKAKDCCHGINIKLMKCGGVREAKRMISIAKLFNLQIMLGCMIESSIAITAAAHLASAVDYLDLDGNLLVSNDPFDGVVLKDTYITLPDRPGLGVIPKTC